MATYVELRALYGDEALTQKIEVAICVAAEKIATANDGAAPFSQDAGKHDLRVQWAKSAIANTGNTAQNVLKLVLAANNSLTTAQINGATDAAIQSAVESVIDALAAV